MIKLNPFSTPEPGTALGRLMQQTHTIQGAVVKSLVEQGHRHVLENSRSLEQALFRPVRQRQESAPQEKGHQLQAWIHISRLDNDLEVFDQESRNLFASQPDAQTGLQKIAQRNEQLTTRAEQRKALLNRRAEWTAATPPRSSELDPITEPILLSAPLNPVLLKQDLEKTLKHVNALDEEIASLDSVIKKQPQPLSRVEEDIFIRRRNAMTEYRNAWATGRLKSSSQLKASLGLSPMRKSLEQGLERSKQLALLDLTLHRQDRLVETAHLKGLDDRFSPGAVKAAREAIVNLRDAWKNGSLDATSFEGINTVMFISKANNQRKKLELAAINNGYVRLNTVPRTQQAGSSQQPEPVNKLAHRDSDMHALNVATRQKIEDDDIRHLLADLEVGFLENYTNLLNNLVLYTRRTEAHGY